MCFDNNGNLIVANNDKGLLKVGKDGKVSNLLENVYIKEIDKQVKYPNGVTVSNETYGYKVIKYYLKGSRAGTKEVFIDGLYGYPDGISSDKEGNFYVAVFAPRKPCLDWVHQYPFIKNQMAKLPKFFLPKPAKASSILVLN